MTRVLQVMAGAEVGGAEAFFERLVPALARAGIEQHAVLRSRGGRAQRLRDAGLPVTECRFGGPLDLASRWRLKTTARRFRPDVVLAWMSRAAAALPTGPWVTAGRLGGYYDLKYYRRCTHLIGNTPDLRRYILDQGWPADRAWHLPNFVDARRLPPASRAEQDTPEDAPLLLCLGRLHRNKGFDVAVAALAEIPGAWLWIAGEGPERSALEDQARSCGAAERVRFLGWRDDVPALFAAADMLVCSSRHEPLGNIVIEAWAQERPVVAAASQGPSQLIEHGVTGLLAPVDDAAALAAGIRSLLADRDAARGLAEQGLDRFRRNFTEAAVVERYKAFFAAVAG